MNTYEWIDRLPLLLDSRDRGRKLLREFCHYLAGKADPDGTNVFPSIDTVSHWLHVTRRTTLGLYRQAEEEKLIIIEKRGHKVIKVRLNFDLPFEALDFPARVVADERRRKARERVARHRARKAEIGSDQCAPIPVTDLVSKVNEPAPIPVTTPREPAPIPVTTQATPLIDPQEDHPPLSTDAADASPAGLDVIEGEVAEPTTGGELVLASELLSTPDAAKACGIGVTKLRKLAAELRVVPAERMGNRARWSLPSLREQLAAVEVPASLALADQLLPDLSSAWVSEWNSGSKAASMPRHDASLWPMPAEARSATEWQRLLVDRWYQPQVKAGRVPSGSECGQVQKHVHGLIAAGNNPNHIAAACDSAAAQRSPNIKWHMDKVRPDFWVTRPGRQIITPQGPVQLPEGMSAGDRRAVAISQWAS